MVGLIKAHLGKKHPRTYGKHNQFLLSDSKRIPSNGVPRFTSYNLLGRSPRSTLNHVNCTFASRLPHKKNTKTWAWHRSSLHVDHMPTLWGLAFGTTWRMGPCLKERTRSGRGKPTLHPIASKWTNWRGVTQKKTQEHHEQISMKKRWLHLFSVPRNVFFPAPPPRVFLFSPSVSESKIPPRLHAQSFATWHPKQNCKQNFVRFSMMSWLLGEKNFKIHIYIYIHMCLNLHISIFMCKKIFASHIAVYQ